MVRQAQMMAFVDVFRRLGFTCLALIPLMFLMKKSGRGKSGAPLH
ncbi:MAG TPA: hypothetical protein VLT57_09880 [Bryobacteraceae bacterium]|nr:hypothetical protein [Bryobacteraceae bacterium]